MADPVAPRSILVIEDSTTYGELATILLGASGYSVAVARTAEEGVRMAQQTRPDLIMVDLNLPGVDGFAAVRMLRQDPRTRPIPTLALTADRVSSDDQHARAREAGFDGHFTKPIDAPAFRGMVEPFLGTGHDQSGRRRDRP